MPPAPSARDQIKQAALRLFAERGIDGVTTRAIVAASGQKNHAAVTYHFGSKEALVRELVADGAKVIDRRRNGLLDIIEARHRPPGIRDIVEALVHPSFNIAAELGGCAEGYIRLYTLLSLTHRDFFMSALENRLNSGYQRCLRHLHRLMPDCPEHLRKRRMVFLEAYLDSVVSLRETALQKRGGGTMWSRDDAVEDLIETAMALLLAPAPAPTPAPAPAPAPAADPGTARPQEPAGPR